MRYRRSGELGGFRDAVRAVACDRDDCWYVAGDREVKVFSPEGVVVRQWAAAISAWSLTVDEEGRVWAGGQGQLDVYSTDGEIVATWKNDELFGLITALAVTPDGVFAADARSRWIHRLDREQHLLNHIGDHHRKGGFHIPNGVLDFAVDRAGTLIVANPGMHRVERYSPAGEPLGYFGRFGQQDPADFPGCCNPTNIALDSRDNVVVSEKAGPRVKIYDPGGGLRTVVSTEGEFDPACKNMDLAVDGRGRIGVIDPVKRVLVLFESRGESA